MLYTHVGLAQSQFPIKFNVGKNNLPASHTVRISFTGDLLVHHDLYVRVAEHPKNDFTILWKKTIPLFNQADFSKAVGPSRFA